MIESANGLMNQFPLAGKTVLVTGAARRVGRALALACAESGADVVIHHGHSAAQALEVQAEIRSLGRQAQIVQADLVKPDEIQALVSKAGADRPLYALVNNAAIFEPLDFKATGLEEWDRHLATNLTAPFLLSQAFANSLPANTGGKIVNILDWRALRPGPDHFSYTISKAGLAALTKSLAAALAPEIQVNALALGAILPPSGQPANPELVKRIPAGRWGSLDEVQQALVFLLAGPPYITGEIIHVDGGRHLT